MRDVYILDFDIYIPRTYVTYEDLAKTTGLPDWVIKEKLGIVRKYVERELSLSDMAKLVSKKLLNKYGNLQIDIVAYAASDFKDYYVWDVAPDVIGSLGLEGSYGFDISMQCVSSIVALDLLKPKLAMQNKDSYALMVLATKQSLIVDYTDRFSSFMYDFSDGAAAILLSNVDGRYKLLEGSVLTDGRFSRVVYQRLGERYFNDNLSNTNYLLAVNRTEDFSKKFEDISFNNFIKVIRDAVEKSGYKVTDIDYLAILHMKRSFHEKILKTLGLPMNKSIYLEEYGHMQSIDPFLSLQLAEKVGVLRKGSMIVLVSAGTGWTWGAYVIQKIKD